MKRYGMALAYVAAAAALRAILHSRLGSQHPFGTFYLAIVASSWYGGFGPGLMAMVLSALVSAYFFLPPDYDLAIDATSDIIGLCIFCAVGFLIVFANQSERAARWRAEFNVEFLFKWPIARHGGR